MKIIAFYLPQFHEIKENNEWWGSGFTEWTNVRKSKPLFRGHEQPRKPLNDYYYDLRDESAQEWQSNLALKYGLYGFCYYHYWFDGKLLLEKPMETMLKNDRISIPFCVCWANEAWTKAWVGGSETLIPQYYGGEQEWEEHFNYLLPFFKDKRYIKENNMPLVVIYRPDVIGCLVEMLELWERLAKRAGFGGIRYAFQQRTNSNRIRDLFDYDIEFQPLYGGTSLRESKEAWMKRTPIWRVLRSAKSKYREMYEKITGADLDRKKYDQETTLEIVNYDEVWSSILSASPASSKSIAGCYVGWDNTPRYGARGVVHTGSTPESFYRYMKRMLLKAREEYSTDYMFLTAWNEWAEGCVMEPDNIHEYGYLEALYRALKESGELQK